jgi:hypothetical protein
MPRSPCCSLRQSPRVSIGAHLHFAGPDRPDCSADNYVPFVASRARRLFPRPMAPSEDQVDLQRTLRRMGMGAENGGSSPPETPSQANTAGYPALLIWLIFSNRCALNANTRTAIIFIPLSCPTMPSGSLSHAHSGRRVRVARHASPFRRELNHAAESRKKLVGNKICSKLILTNE